MHVLGLLMGYLLADRMLSLWLNVLLVWLCMFVVVCLGVGCLIEGLLLAHSLFWYERMFGFVFMIV